MDSYERWRTLLRHQRLPAAVVDLDAVEHNARVLRAALDAGAAGHRKPTLRIASKSVRSPALLHRLLDLDPGFVGLMTMTAHESVALAEQGHDDMLVAYPASRPDEARALAELAARGVTAVAMVDSTEHVALLDAAGRKLGVQIPVAIDVDVSLRLGGGVHLGVRRSPVRDVNDALAVAQACGAAKGVRLCGVMAYEAQVAGIADHSDQRLLDPVKRLIKRSSVPLARKRRGEIVAALRTAGHEITLVNGGGTGSVQSTASDPSVTEVTAGSGFLCPHLFDGYDGLALRPAAFFVLSVARISDPDHVTCFGGGYIASGPPAADRAPTVHLPQGLAPIDLEGFGEVQTPLFTKNCRVELQLGDPVLCRHAKAGDLGERFNEYVLVRGGEVVERVATYRGLGGVFA